MRFYGGDKVKGKQGTEFEGRTGKVFEPHRDGVWVIWDGVPRKAQLVTGNYGTTDLLEKPEPK